ncbi:unnamed protein product [Ectocarpus sp. 12 AP-2014]
MQVLVRDDLADALIQTASSTLRNAATSNENQDASSDGVAPMTNFTSATRSSFPSTWSPGSSIQLMPPKLSDTTDRSLFRRARLAVFDPHGYRHQRGLRRPLFYKSGYLSCTKCNGLTFIDASALRTILELKSLGDFGKVRPENLPPCVGCGQTAGLRVGAHDFLSLIEGGKEALARRRRLERIAAKMLQRAFRRHLHIQWRKAEIIRQHTVQLLRYRSAQVIQAMLRGRLGRRVFETEKWLTVVKKAHRLLIKHALDHYPHRKRVFWYKNEAEERQLYADYRMLVLRTGFRPPRIVVEQNIREIATRVLEREAELVRRIQARWRGLSVRRYLVVFRKELRRHREVRASMVFRLQRTVRGWSHRKRFSKLKSQKAEQNILADYLATRATKNNDDACTEGMSRLRRAYVTERQEELTARLMGHSNPKLAGGLKMKAFFESPYGDDVVSGLMNHQVWQAWQQRKDLEQKDLERQKRAEWVRLKQLEDPQLAKYFKEEMTTRNVYVINKLRWDRRALKNVASALKDYNRTGGRKYDFPETINQDPMAILFERHSTDGQALLRRYSKGNV